MTSSVWRRQQHYFVLGLLLGALVSGVLAGALGGFVIPVPARWRWALAALLLIVILAFELAGRPLSLPQNRRAVPQTIIPRASFSGPLQFGFEMGTGLRTFMPTALPHALLLTVVLVGGLLPGVVAGLGFGVGRALMPIVRSRHRDPAAWDDDLLDHLAGVGRLCAIGFLAALLAIGATTRSGLW